MDNFVIYHLENAQQFWAELEDILARVEQNEEAVRACVDTYVGFVTTFQDDYLETETDLAICCYKLLDSRMYENYQKEVSELIMDRAVRRNDLKELWVTYHLLLLAGRENIKIFKLMESTRKHEFIKKLRQHIWKLDGHRVQKIAIQLLFEICCVQRLSKSDLRMIDEQLLNYLLDLVEKTRDERDETFNYSIIKLILAFNEQYMVAKNTKEENAGGDEDDVVLRVLGTRIGTSKTFGENVIFMLNRCVEPHIQLLILKLLYQIFTTPATYEYFYTNDLMVLVDVFIRELYDLPDDSEPLRHCYLRVLYPLLENTQLRLLCYKQHQIYILLVDLIGTDVNHIKPVSSTTRRLAERCLMVSYLSGIVTHSEEKAAKTVTGVENVANSGAPAPIFPNEPEERQHTPIEVNTILSQTASSETNVVNWDVIAGNA